MVWSFKRYDELTRDELYDLLRLRCEVFVVEQSCAYLDVDGDDCAAWHLTCRDDGGKLAACLRALPAHGGEPMHLGRIVVDPSRRGAGLGRELVRRGLEHARALGQKQVKISAQEHLRGFYASFGFAATSQPYDDAGILHIDMTAAL